jgi:hypothetical protein
VPLRWVSSGPRYSGARAHANAVTRRRHEGQPIPSAPAVSAHREEAWAAVSEQQVSGRASQSRSTARVGRPTGSAIATTRRGSSWIPRSGRCTADRRRPLGDSAFGATSGPGGLTSRTTGRTRSQKRLRAAAALGWVRSVPDECFWSDVEIARPGDRPIPGADAAEESIVGAQAIEHRTPKQVLDVPLHNRTVRQGETEPPTFKWLGRSNAKQHHRMLAQRWNAVQRKVRSGELPVRSELFRME